LIQRLYIGSLKIGANVGNGSISGLRIMETWKMVALVD
jgi:hypothetical protein